MSTQGPNNGTTFVVDSSYGTKAWSNPENVQASDNSYASVGPSWSSGYSYYLKATGFGFTIPDGASIDDIKIEVEGKYSGVMGSVTARPVIGGAISGTEPAYQNLTTSDAIYSFSGLFGLSPSPADINYSNFGAAICCYIKYQAGPAGGLTTTDYIDHVKITITYTLSPSLTVNDSSHSLGNDSISIAQTHLLTVQDGNSLHLADGVELSQAHILTVSDGTHSQFAENVDICSNPLEIQDSAHGLSNDAITLTQEHILAVADGVNNHFADNLVFEIGLSVSDAHHALFSDNIISFQAAVLQISNSRHSILNRDCKHTGWDGELSDKPVKRYGMELLDFYPDKKNKNKHYLTVN